MNFCIPTTALILALNASADALYFCIVKVVQDCLIMVLEGPGNDVEGIKTYLRVFLISWTAWHVSCCTWNLSVTLEAFGKQSLTILSILAAMTR
jgi:hypothetical protein